MMNQRLTIHYLRAAWQMLRPHRGETQARAKWEPQLRRPTSRSNGFQQVEKKTPSTSAKSSPGTATTSLGSAPLFRRALYVVTPAHIKGPASTGESSSGISASAGREQSSFPLSSHQSSDS